jgi:glycosyltransferase involved in cell wall biosynthesis
MANILVEFTQPLGDLRNDVRAGRQPNHLLYGVDYLEKAGHRIVDVSGPPRPWAVRLDRRLARLPLPIGSFDHQLRALERLAEIDLIYSATDIKTHLLYLARAAGFLRVPIVSLAHHPLRRGHAQWLREPWLRAVLKGASGSSIATLSQSVAAEINTIARTRVAEPLTWGPDANFYRPAEYPGHGVLAIGRTGRDFVTLARAARITGTPLTIISWAVYLDPIRAELDAPNIETVGLTEMLPHSDLLARFASARAIAVPLIAGGSLSGLTGVMDALGTGKPILVTRKATLDLDVDRLGIGYAIDVGDVDGWANALRVVEADPRKSTEMGRRARALVDGGMTSSRFAAGLGEIIERSLERRV